ncbi:hypothetical protein ACFYO7_02470 [Nocardia salmonicida]
MVHQFFRRAQLRESLAVRDIFTDREGDPTTPRLPTSVTPA